MWMKKVQKKRQVIYFFLQNEKQLKLTVLWATNCISFYIWDKENKTEGVNEDPDNGKEDNKNDDDEKENGTLFSYK